MATKYSDIITLREQKAAYNIENEKEGDWELFLTNEQFNNEILKKVIASVRNNDTNLHKSFWLEGTYGTGKSHAGAVIKHLLCDPLEAIRGYIEEEYRDPKFALLRNDLLKLRENKRLFPVTMYGTQSISHRDDLSLQLQRAVSLALKKASINITVKTDFDNYISHIEANRHGFWDNLIADSPKLKSIVPTRERLIAELQNGDTGTLAKVKEVLREERHDIRMDSADLKQWFFEVQNELAAHTDYDGIFVIWDEFTDMMNSPVGQTILVALQEIDETVMNSENNSYFFYISHPSALNSLTEQERNKTKGRYHYMHYNMEPVSAFKIMSKKFQPKEDSNRFAQYTLAEKFYNTHRDLLDVYSRTSSDPEETKHDLMNLFPLHPSTANLATYYAREAGSSSRSVFQFIGENDAVRIFLDSEERFAHHDTITADFLWDYVVGEFNDNVIKYGAVTERFNSRKLQVEYKGEDYFAVFKSILLLNALNNIANTETVTPSEENIRNLFAGTHIEDYIDDILNYFDENSIIQRLPGGLFSIMFSALPPQEIEETKNRLKESSFKFTSQVIGFGDTAKKLLDSQLKNVVRPMQYRFYSEDSNEHILIEKIERAYKECKPYEIFLAMLFARNAGELNNLKTFATKYGNDERLHNIVLVVFDTILTDKNYERFIEYQANAACALNHSLADQKLTHEKSASGMIKEWVNDIKRGNCTYYLRGRQEVNSASRITTTINNVIAPIIFEHGPESLELIQSRPTATYWKKQSTKAIVDAILLFDDKQEVLSKCMGPAQHIPLLLQDSVDDNMQWKQDVNQNHPMWLVSEFIERKFRYTDKNQSFNLGDKLIELTQPPYGLFETYSCMGMVAFAMRKYRGQIFDLNGRPREAKHLVDDIVDMFKAWENGKSNRKLEFRFETKESRKLFDVFVKTFQLDKLSGVNEVTSLTNARWAITHNFSSGKGYPLWALKYTYDKEGFREMIDYIIKICGENDMRNPDLINNTLDGLETYRFELGNRINDKDSFRDGFLMFLKSVEGVNMQDNEAEEAMTYLKRHMQGDVGLWAENEVSKQLTLWRMAKNEEEKRHREEEERKKREQEEEKEREKARLEQEAERQRKLEEAHKYAVSADKRMSAKGRVKKISNINKAQDMLERICEIANDEVLDIINSYDV